MYCGYCGKELPDDAEFCIVCGKTVIKPKSSVDLQSEEAMQAVKTSEEYTPENSVAPPPMMLTDADTVDAICPYCGYNGKMQIVQRNTISTGNKLLLYIICYGALFALAYVLELIFVPIFPTWILYIFGFMVGGIAIKSINAFIKGISIRDIKCPKCKQVLEYKH